LLQQYGIPNVDATNGLKFSPGWRGAMQGRFVAYYRVWAKIPTKPRQRKFKLGPLGSLNQVTKGLAKTIRAMADGTLDSQVGARICNGLGIMRACLETQKLEQLEARMDKIADRVPHKRASTHEADRLSH
jgi:hypothetical protein